MKQLLVLHIVQFSLPLPDISSNVKKPRRRYTAYQNTRYRISTRYWLIPKAQVLGPILTCNWALRTNFIYRMICENLVFEPGDYFVGTWGFISASTHLSTSPTTPQTLECLFFTSNTDQQNALYYANTTFKIRCRKSPFYFSYML